MRRLIFMGLLLALVAGAASAQDIAIVGSGSISSIQPGTTATGDIAASEQATLGSIGYVGHNGGNRHLGDADAWTFAPEAGAAYIIRATTTGGDLVPSLLLVSEYSIPSVSAWDANLDGDANAGLCIRQVAADATQYAVLVSRQPDTRQEGSYQLTVERVAPDALANGTMVCPAGTFVTPADGAPVDVHAGPGTEFSYRTTMQPGEIYNLFSGGYDGWVQVLYYDAALGYVMDGYAPADRVTLLGALPTPVATAETTAVP
jgi:hypothetical protein